MTTPNHNSPPSPPYIETAFPVLQVEFVSFFFYRCASLGRVWLCLLYTPSCYIVSLPSLPQAEQTHFSQPILPCPVPQLLTHMAPVCQCLFCACACASAHSGLPMLSRKCQIEENKSFPWPAGYVLVLCAAGFCCKDTLQIHIELIIHQTCSLFLHVLFCMDSSGRSSIFLATPPPSLIPWISGKEHARMCPTAVYPCVSKIGHTN